MSSIILLVFRCFFFVAELKSVCAHSCFDSFYFHAPAEAHLFPSDFSRFLFEFSFGSRYSTYTSMFRVSVEKKIKYFILNVYPMSGKRVRSNRSDKRKSLTFLRNHKRRMARAKVYQLFNARIEHSKSLATWKKIKYLYLYELEKYWYCFTSEWLIDLCSIWVR